jgi:hypothetical protein
MPALASLAAFAQAVAEFPVSDPGLVLEPAAQAAAERSVRGSGFLLLGEVHGVRENPLLIRALLRALGLTSLALEWGAELAPAIRAFLAGGALADHPLLWFGDGRITAGHLAVLRERAAAGPLELTLMDGTLPGGIGGADWSWSQRDEAMAARVLAAAGDAGTLVVAATPTPRSSPQSWVSCRAPCWLPGGRAPARSGSTTAAAASTTSGRAGSRHAPARAGCPRGSFSATKTSPSYSPLPLKRSCPSGPGHRSALDSDRNLAQVRIIV